jgi:hypothetical protein
MISVLSPVDRTQPTAGGMFEARHRCRSRLLAEDLENDHGIGIDPIDDPPRLVPIVDAKLMAARADGGHRASVRHADVLALLYAAQKEPGLDTGLLGEGRCLELATQPDQWSSRPPNHDNN